MTFKTRREAYAAIKSTEPIFNNRFIKVFWQNETDADGQAATEASDEAKPDGAAAPSFIPLSTTVTAPGAGPILRPRRMLPVICPLKNI